MPPPKSPHSTDPLQYQAYLLRLWRATDQEPPLWRASLEDPHTGERLSFADLTQLFAYLTAQASPGSQTESS